jgi:hypothetical protein
MSSIFVDTIRKTGGTLGTDIRVKTTSVYESENSTGTTQNLVQGLSKHWVNINGDTPAARDSLNNASLTDGGNGNYTITRTNNFNSTGYCCQGGGNSSASGDGRITALDEATLSTSANEIHNRSDANGVQDDLHVNVSFLGDLA